MENHEVLEKIKKLIALATSPNEHEAALAMEKASKLLEKHNLSMADLQSHKAVDPTMFMVSKEMGKRVPKWIQILYLHVAQVFDCELLIQKHVNSLQSYAIVGQKDDIEMTKHFCAYFIITIPKLAEHVQFKNYGEYEFRRMKTKEKNDFIYGATVTVIGRLKEMYRKMSTTKSTALVLANKKKVVADYIANNFRTRTQGIKGKQKISRQAYMAGVHAGKNMSIQTPIAEPEQTRQIA